VRLFLSSFRFGSKPNLLLGLLRGGVRTALIGNALDHLSESERSVRITEEMDRLVEIGLSPTEVDLRKFFGRARELKTVLKDYDLVWSRGGNAFILRRAFRASGMDEVLITLLREDKVVYGGYSAGVDMVCTTLRGVEFVDDPNIVPSGYNREIVWDGLGILNYSIASHYKSDHPESEDIDVSIDYMVENRIPFVPLRDGEVIIIDGDKEVRLGCE
jgi:dipeptidase E